MNAAVNARALLVLVFVLTAGAIGFLAGYLARDSGGRAMRGTERTDIRMGSRPAALTVTEAMELERRARQAEALVEENTALKRRVAQLEQAAGPDTGEEALAPGSRREDGSSVGGARWPAPFVRTATAYVDRMFSQFIDEAGLTPAQEQRLRSELTVRIGQMMQLSADYTNGDLDADGLYDRISELASQGQAGIDNLLDDAQVKVYDKFFRKTRTMIRGQVVNNEMINLKAELKLDSEQERHVRRIVEARYQRVEERHGNPVPNLMFKPIRREADRDIYDETAEGIRSYLRPDQLRRFEAADREAATVHMAYRSFLVPGTVAPGTRSR